MKNIYLIVGPSGSGKTMVANRLEEKYRLKQVLSYTERPPRFEGEGGHTFVSLTSWKICARIPCLTGIATAFRPRW